MMSSDLLYAGNAILEKKFGPKLKSAPFSVRQAFYAENGTSWSKATYEEREKFLEQILKKDEDSRKHRADYIKKMQDRDRAQKERYLNHQEMIVKKEQQKQKEFADQKKKQDEQRASFRRKVEENSRRLQRMRDNFNR